MTKDLEETLAGLGPEYRAVVDRVIGAYEVEGGRCKEGRGDVSNSSVQPLTSNLQTSGNRGALVSRRAAYLVAASLLVLLAFGVLFRAPTVRGTSGPRLAYTVAYVADEAALAVILASQRTDGSWDNDYITRQNAAALRNVRNVESQVAYKRAVRYLKSRGLRPLSDDELRARGDEAARLLAKS